MPIADKLAKDKICDCMGEYSSLNKYTLSEQKWATSILGELKHHEELNGISGPLKFGLTRIIKNNSRHKDKSYSNCQEGTFSCDVFHVLLSKSEHCWFHIIKPNQWKNWLNDYCSKGYLNRTA